MSEVVDLRPWRTGSIRADGRSDWPRRLIVCSGCGDRPDTGGQRHPCCRVVFVGAGMGIAWSRSA